MKSLILLAILLCVHFATAAQCPEGYFYEIIPHTHTGECDPCQRGYFCPGDDSEHPCTGNTFQSVEGSSSCLPCPSSAPFASPSHTFCIPADKPSDLKLLSISSIISYFTANANGSHYAGELHFESGVKQMMVTFRSYHSGDTYALYASTKTAAPSKDNYEYKAEGANVTITIARPAGSSLNGDVYLPIFLTLVGNTDTFAAGAALPVRYDTISVSASGESVSYNFTSTASYILFDVVDVKPNVPVTVVLEGTAYGTKFDRNFVSAFVSQDPAVAYPNDMNYSYRDVQGPDSPVKIALKLPKSDSGVAHFSAFLYSGSRTYNLKVYVENQTRRKALTFN